MHNCVDPDTFDQSTTTRADDCGGAGSLLPVGVFDIPIVCAPINGRNFHATLPFHAVH